MPVFHEQGRAELRRMYVEVWRKFCAQEALEPLEAQIAHVIAEHPEYHALLKASEAAVHAEFLPEGDTENPFLHLGLHLAVREQVDTDRPAGIRQIHEKLVMRYGTAHAAEHRMFEVLGQTLWEAQRAGRAPEEALYVERLRQL